MKRLFVITFIILTSAIAFGQTQPTSLSDTYRNLFKVSAAMFTRNTFQMGFEHFFNPTTSLQVNGGMNFKDSEYDQFWGVITEAQLRFHVYTQIKTRNSHRLYFAPYILNNYEEQRSRYWNNNGYESWQTDSFDAVGTGILFGWSFSFANRVNLDIYTGGGIRKTFNADTDYYAGVWDYYYSGIAPRLGIDVGFWF